MKVAFHPSQNSGFSLAIGLLASSVLFSGFYTSIAKSPEDVPGTRVQIVNATSVPAISLKIDGKLFYPEFKQGLQSGEFPIEAHRPTYTVSDIATKRQVTQKITYDKNSLQSLVITGDFRPVSRIRSSGKAVLEPYLEFNVLSHLQTSDQRPLRYRFLNGLSSTKLSIQEAGEAWVIAPGQIVSFHDQPPVKLFTIEAEDKSIEALIRQDGNALNCTVVFYEKAGSIKFMRIFETVPDKP